MYAVNPSLTFVHFLCWFVLVLFDLFFFCYLRIIRTTGRSEGKHLSNSRLEMKYIILGRIPMLSLTCCNVKYDVIKNINMAMNSGKIRFYLHIIDGSLVYLK